MMRPAVRQLKLLRTARFETFEERLALTSLGVADFSIDQSVLDHVEQLVGDVQTTLSDVHDMTGVNYVRNSFGFDGSNQTVAVIDSGIAYDHYALGQGFGNGYRVVGGWDFTEENDADPYDDGPAGFHGTHVAGIIGSSDSTYMGVAPDVDLVGLRVFNDQGDGYFSWVESALQWVHDNRNAFENPITTVNLSLGATWNADTIPNWAILEEEFAQLEADGIFISVSAGNDFTDYNTTGLSYPAASPYVVPVASVGNDGTLSSFSQRNDRVIAAPGEMIASTVPDYLFGSDGVPNDFASASGTSMASPYIAGASVLVREAMDFLGYTNVTQDTIYDHLRATADSVWDGATSQSYYSLNLQSALDALMPTDDYGSTAGAAYSLGTIFDTNALAGLVGRMDDQDFFSFTAGTDGEVTFSATATDDMVVDWQLVGGGGTLNGDSLTFDVLAGQTYTLSLGTSGGIGYYNVDTELVSTVTDWGVIELNEFADQNLSSADQWYSFTTTRAGTATVEAFFAHAAGNVNLELYDTNLVLLASSNSTTNNERVDTVAGAGEQFFLKVSGTNADVDFRIANLINVSGATAEVYGTTAGSVFSFTAGATHVVSVDGVVYQLDGATVSTVNFYGGAGTDSITLQGTAADETLVVRVGSVDLTGPGYDAHATGMENVVVLSGGGSDVAYLYDSVGNDTLTARPDRVRLTGTGFDHRVDDFDQVYIHATAGGTNDRAYLYDSAGNDRFEGRVGYSTLSGSGFYNQARGFDFVFGYATSGGTNDRAYLYDSAGDDLFFARSHYSYLRGNGFYNQARGFEFVFGYSDYGGNDSSWLCDSAGDDVFYSRPGYSFFRGSGFYNQARGFDSMIARSVNGGNDTAVLYDSLGDDTFTRNQTVSQFTGAGFYSKVMNFDFVKAFTTGGYDRAEFHDVAATDTFQGADNMAVVSDVSFDHRVYNFDFVQANSKDSETATADISAVDYVFEQVGSWQ